jgi:hypothetical protein
LKLKKIRICEDSLEMLSKIGSTKSQKDSNISIFIARWSENIANSNLLFKTKSGNLNKLTLPKL